MKDFVVVSALLKIASSGKPEDAGACNFNPCCCCDLREWCQEDCAHHLYPLFVESEPEDFENWLSE